MRVDALVKKYPVRIREVTLGTLFLLLLIFYFSPRFYSTVITNSYNVVKQIETFDIPQTQQIKIPDPPARPSVPMASEDEFFDEDITIEDTDFEDLGRYNITGNPLDQGLFKSPTLRNIEFSSPYMHDGRFNTLDEVIEHYNFGGHDSPTVDPLMKYVGVGLLLSSCSSTGCFPLRYIATPFKF